MTKLFKLILYISVFTFLVINFIWKLDYKYFFTDEILYAQTGKEILEGDFTQNRQVPLIGKYISGIAYNTFGHNVFFIRLPFAIIGLLTAFIISLIIKDHFDKKLAFIGLLLFSSFPFIFQTSRMALLEAPMHFFWIVSVFFIFRRKIILSAIFLGLSFAVKFTMIITLPIFILYLFKDGYKKMIIFVFVIFITFISTYLPMFIKEGFNAPLYVARSIKDTYFQRNIEGKNGEYSPSSLYFDAILKEYPIHLTLLSIFSIILFLLRPDKYSFFWFLNLILLFLFNQILPLKNERYISTLEIPIIFLIISFIDYYRKSKIITLGINLSLFFILTFSIIRIINLRPDKYNAFKIYLEERQAINSSKILITGSFRSSKWYFDKKGQKNIVLSKDHKSLFYELPSFEYIAVDPDEFEIEKEERNLNKDTTLKRYLSFNKDNYIKRNVGGLLVFEKDPSKIPVLKK